MAVKKPSRRKATSTALVKTAEIVDTTRFTDEVVRNGLAQALGIPSNNFYGPGVGNNPYAPQISQTNTLFLNLRWYLVSNFRQPLSEAYVELGLLQTIVDVPVDDALRGGIEVNSSQLDPAQLKKLVVRMERENDLVTVGQGSKWQRLYGGGAILIQLDDQDPEDELDIDAITDKSGLAFRAVDMWELFPESQNMDGLDPESGTTDFECYDFYGKKVHRSRVMILKGRTPPSFLAPRLRGWGLSEVETLIRSINQYLKATDLTFACLDEFKVDVYKLKNLANTLLSPSGEQKVRERIHIANASKNYQNAIILDKEDDWDHKQISFTGLAETLEGIRMQVASEMHFPITKLFGTTAGKGLGNTDQNDMENYNAMIEAQVRNKIKYHILRMVELRCQEMFGMIPDDLEVSFRPLRELTAVEEETVKTSKFARLLQAQQAGLIDSKTFYDGCNKDNLLSVQVDPDMVAIEAPEAEEPKEEDL